jgi:hypothetical protein
MHTHKTKQQSKQWLEKGVPGPVQAKVHATRTKTVVLAFFYSQGVLYNHYVPKGQTVNLVSFVKMLQEFLRQLKNKRPQFGVWVVVPALG